MSSDTSHPSPLLDRHEAAGATMTDFAGWWMPLNYGSVVAEHQAVRTGCGVFDLSHLGNVWVTGADAVRCVRAALSNDPTALEVGGSQYTLCLDEQGGIVDDLIVYRVEEGYLAIPNAANTAAVADALRACAEGDAAVHDVSRELACVALQGPQAAEIAAAAGLDVEDLEYLRCRSVEGGVLARTGYTGERGYEAFIPPERAAAVWDAAVAAGAQPAGLGARDTLRLEVGYPLHGNDISPATSPVEARLSWAVKTEAEFRGREAFLAAKEAGPKRRLWGLRALERGIPRKGQEVLADGAAVGEITSGTFSPTLRIGIALGYLDRAIEPDAEVVIDVRGKPVRAEVVKPPFVNADPRR